MRGKQSVCHFGCAFQRLIPAHAGKTQRARDLPSWARAHPRSCGENAKGAGSALLGAGSSPLMRGKPRLVEVTENRDGLIPAHAGKTPPSGPCRARARAHPRSCGENTIQGATSCGYTGSSPLMRGKQISEKHELCARGLIPAHAGKTDTEAAAEVLKRAHPRSCGENNDLLLGLHTDPGSSPLMRGKPVEEVRHVYCGGLIPAHAGKTCRS